MFITHGGHGGSTEAIYNGVPLVGLPMFGDQVWNMKQAEKKGFAISLNILEITEEDLFQAINKVLTDPRYKCKNSSATMGRMCNVAVFNLVSGKRQNFFLSCTVIVR